MSEFTKVKAPRTFGSLWITDNETGKTVAAHELIDGVWVETPEYKELMKNKTDSSI